MRNNPENRVVTPTRIAVGLSSAAVVALLRFLGSAGEANAQTPLDTPTPVGVIATYTPIPVFLPNGFRVDVTPTAAPTPTNTSTLTPTATKEPTSTSTATATATATSALTPLQSKDARVADLERQLQVLRREKADDQKIADLEKQIKDLESPPTPTVSTPITTPTPTSTLTPTATATPNSLESAKQTAADLERKVATERERVATQAMIDRLNEQFAALQKTPTLAVPTATFSPTSISTPTAQEKLQKIVADLEQEAADARAKAAANDRIDRLNKQIEALSNTPTPKPDVEATKTALLEKAAKEVAAIQATAIASAKPSPAPKSVTEKMEADVASKEKELADEKIKAEAKRQLEEKQRQIDDLKNPPSYTWEFLVGGGFLSLAYLLRGRRIVGGIPGLGWMVGLRGPRI